MRLFNILPHGDIFKMIRTDCAHVYLVLHIRSKASQYEAVIAEADRRFNRGLKIRLAANQADEVQKTAKSVEVQETAQD